MASRQQRAAAERLREDRRFWQSVVAEVGRARMNQPGPMGEWTFKDLTAHLAAWRNYRIPMVEAAGRGEPIPAPPWPAELAEDDYDEINAWFQQRDAARSLDDVLGDYDGSFERLARAIEELPEDVAHDPQALPWMGGETAVDADFTEHLHGEHLPAIRAWLDSLPG
jgi:hypothetical protein